MKRLNLLCIGISLFFCAAGWPALSQGNSETPNIILILADDMGQECIGAYGSSYPTPHIDRLAREGIRFNYAFSQPLCTPSRVQIMTGKYNYKNYVEFTYLDPLEKTFGHLAKAAGYTTCIAGKWQLGRNNKLPGHFGFDQYCLWQLTQLKNKGERYANPLIETDGEFLKVGENEYGPDIFVEYILRFIEKNKDRKFFAYYPMALVHDPFVSTPDSKDWDSKPSSRYKSDTTYFRDMVAYADKNVGKIVARLKELNLYENTLILFTSDNGTSKEVVTPMRDGRRVQGGKSFTVDRGIRVPFIANWAKMNYRNHECDDLVDFTDIMATVADAMQVKVPGEWNTDGRSIFPQIQGKEGTPRKWIFSHYNPIHNERVNVLSARFFRTHRYKYYHDGRFFDLLQDAEEKKPIPVNQGSAEAERVRNMLHDEMRKLPPWKPGDPGQPKNVIPGMEPVG